MSTVFDLKSLLAAAEIPKGAGPTPDRDAESLRLRLAVRGWTEPRDQIDTTWQARRDSLLATLAADVETSVEARPGLWYLAASVRRRVLGQATRADLLAAMTPRSEDDRTDPLRIAFELWLNPPLPALADIPDGVLAMFGSVGDWLGNAAPVTLTPVQIAAEIAARTQKRDLDRMTQYPMVGEAHRQALDSLAAFASKPSKSAMSAVYVYGGGGSGKTTLLAFLQRQAVNNSGAFARIDFDEPTVDPTRMATLNIELYSQLTRSVAGLADHSSFILENLRTLAQAQRSSAISDQSSGNVRRPSVKRSQNIQAEGWVSEAASSESSILYGTLAPAVLGGPLVLILDTAELILAQSDRAATGVVNWLDFLSIEAGARDIRLIIAGRDQPPQPDSGNAGYAVSNLLQRLADRNADLAPAIALPELTPAEAATLLTNCGVSDARVAEAAAEAVPGNPLLLRITADALLDSDGEVQKAVQDAHRAIQIDPASARNYLMRRIVAHVADPEARPYVLGAMFSPIITRKLLQEAIIPAVERNSAATDKTLQTQPKVKRQADRVFRALAAAQWLTRPSLDSTTLSFNRDLRDFALRLLRSGVAGEVFERDVRQSAAIHHLRHTGVLHRALALYHLAVLGQPYTRPRGSAREPVRNLLRDVLEELPADLRIWLDPPPVVAGADLANPVAGIAQPTGSGTVSDEEWRLYLEGPPGKDGQGMLLVKDDNAAEALRLYQSRPTRPKGLAPAFVVRALADLGRWNDSAASVEAILAHEAGRWMKSGRHSPDDLSQIYWITRLALQRDQAHVSRKHIELLRHVASTAKGPGLTMLPALIVVAEAAMREPIMDERMRNSVLKSGSEARIMLGVTNNNQRYGTVQIAFGQIAVAQADWARILTNNKTFGSDFVRMNLTWVQDALNGLIGRPIAQANQVFEKLSRLASVNADGLDAPDLALLFRGRTPEFHRPLREALLSICGDGKIGRRTLAVVDPVLKRLSIRPTEMESKAFYERLTSNPRAWAAALISFADQARLLPLLAEGLFAHSQDEQSRQIAQSFITWDYALCRGTSSLWPSQR